MKKIFSLFIIMFLLSACGSRYQTINSNRAMELINDGAVIIDVRTKEEFNDSHIVGAVNIPLDKITTINYEKEKTLIVYCATGVRSVEALKKLYDLGYTSLYNLDGGLLNWGFELEE